MHEFVILIRSLSQTEMRGKKNLSRLFFFYHDIRMKFVSTGKELLAMEIKFSGMNQIVAA